MITPEKSLGSSSGGTLHKLRVIWRLDLLGGAAEHGEHREADGADCEGGRPF